MTRLSHPIGYLVCGLIIAVSVLTGTPRTHAGDAPKRIRIIYTNDTLGYLEPCGCGGRYEGGLSRRGPAIARLIKANPNTIILDSGNLSEAPDKLEIIASIMASMKYDAVGIGLSDSIYRKEFLRVAQAHDLTVIDPTRASEKPVVAYLTRNLAGVRVGVVSFGANCSPRSPASLQAFCRAYKAARQSSDVLILLDQGGIATRQWLLGNADGLGAPDEIIGGASNGVIAQDQVIGKTHILPTSQSGRHLGVADITISDDGSLQTMSHMLVIDKNTDEDPAIARRIEEFLLKPSRQAALKAQTANFGKGKYTSPEACKDCHGKIYHEWRKTSHASAVATLTSANRMIPDCLPCHSEQYRQTLKATRHSDAATGVECATCHASVIPHGKNGPAKSASRRVNPKLCVGCHTPDRSPDYREGSYIERVSHKGIRH